MDKVLLNEIIELLKNYGISVDINNCLILEIKSEKVNEFIVYVTNKDEKCTKIVLNSLDFSFDLVKVLYKLEFIGKQSHIQELNILFNEDDIPIITVKQIGIIIISTIFD